MYSKERRQGRKEVEKNARSFNGNKSSFEIGWSGLAKKPPQK